MLSLPGWVASGLWWVTCLALLCGVRNVLPTQLVGPWAWACLAAALLAVAQTQRALAPEDPAARAVFWPYAAVTASMCPLVALFGAKRPQSGPWQFVVLGLWIILMLPALESLVVGRSEPDTAGLRVAFMWVLVACGVVNYMATRFAFAATLAAVAQGLCVARLLCPLPAAWAPTVDLTAAVLAALAVVACHWPLPRPANRADRLWLDFRDRFGAVWALRVMVRMNVLTEHRGWPVRVRWSGFILDPQATPVEVESFQRSFTMLLRSFVSKSWVQQRRAPPHAES